MSDNTSNSGKGLLDSLTVLAGSLVSIARTRLELLSIDLEEDRIHLLSVVLLSLAALFSLVVGVVLVAILLVVIFWESHRLLVLGSLAGFFLVTGLVACGFAVRKTKTKPRLFTASLLELFKDSQQLDLP
jgi:uncharacterized membrane protein YqjE